MAHARIGLKLSAAWPSLLDPFIAGAMNREDAEATLAGCRPSPVDNKSTHKAAPVQVATRPPLFRGELVKRAL